MSKHDRCQCDGRHANRRESAHASHCDRVAPTHRARFRMHARSFAAFLSLAAAVVHAQGYDKSLFGALKWKNIGPNRGGRSLTTAGSPGRPLEYYFGAVGGGLWKTTDGGNSWKPVTDGQIRSSSVGAVAVAESNPDVVYIGM